jgi:hypothetical protein
MWKSMAVFLLAAFAALTLPANQLMGDVILPNLPPGSSYQLIFVTTDLIRGTSGTEGPYNALVNTDAAPINTLLVSAGITGVTWHAITNTIDGTLAAQNAPWLSVPVYNDEGFQINIPSESLYAAALQNPILYTEFGVKVTGEIWTGAASDGLLGSSSQHPVAYGDSGSIDSKWEFYGYNFPDNPLSLYGQPFPHASLTCVGSIL